MRERERERETERQKKYKIGREGKRNIRQSRGEHRWRESSHKREREIKRD